MVDNEFRDLHRSVGGGGCVPGRLTVKWVMCASQEITLSQVLMLASGTIGAEGEEEVVVS